MKSLFFALMMLMAAGAIAQPRAVVTAREFKPAEGAFKGSITYLDYTSGKPFSMPADVSVRVAGSNLVVLSLNYPQEPKANGNDTLTISKDWMTVNGAPVTDKSVMEDGVIKFVTEENGLDGNDHKKAIIRHIYIFGKTIFQTRKEVKFEGTDKWIMRNEFLFTR